MFIQLKKQMGGCFQLSVDLNIQNIRADDANGITQLTEYFHLSQINNMFSLTCAKCFRKRTLQYFWNCHTTHPHHHVYYFYPRILILSTLFINRNVQILIHFHFSLRLLRIQKFSIFKLRIYVN